MRYLSDFFDDLVFGWRMLRRTPGLSLLVVVTLALGIGANGTIFNFFKGFVNPPMPYREADRLMYITGRDARNQRCPVSGLEFAAWRERRQVLASAAGFQGRSFNVNGDGGPERVKGDCITPDFFVTLGVRPALGRDFLPEEFKPGAPRAIILSGRLWHRSFGSSRDVVGRSVLLDGLPATVVGVMPEDFRFILGESAPRLWIPLPVQVGGTGAPDPAFKVIARLAQGISAERARDDLDWLEKILAEQAPELLDRHGVRLESLRSLTAPRDILLISLMLELPVGFVLLIACTNVANILLAKAAARRKELAMRAALGACRGRILRQLLTESALFCLLAGAASLIMAVWASRAIVGFLPFDPFEGLDLEPPHLSLQLVAFTLGTALLSSLLCGLLPALRVLGVDLIDSVKGSGYPDAGGSSRQRAGRVLITTEIAISVVLLIGAGLVIKSYGRLRDMDTGYRRDGILTMHLTLSQTQYPDSQRRAMFLRRLQELLTGLPGVKLACLTSSVPPLPGTASVRILGRPYIDHGDAATACYRSVSQNYFSAFSIPMLRGRPFGDQDVNGAIPTAIINEAMANRYWPEGDPIGAQVEVDGKVRRIVGVACNVKNAGLQPSSRPEVAVPFLQECPETMTLAIESARDSTEVVNTVRRQIRSIDPNLPLSSVETMRNVYVRTLREHHLLAPLLAGVGGLGLGLAVVGLYGFTTYYVSLRRREIGIRRALGASGSDVLRLLLVQGLAPTVTGVALGSLAAGVLMRALSSMLYGVQATDPFVFGSVSLLLTGVSAVAWYLPARKAVALHPMSALRCE